jgi:hypothetical protein
VIEKVSTCAGDSRHAVALLRNVIIIAACSGMARKMPLAGKFVDWPHLGAFAGVCYTIWAGSGIV